MTTSSVRSSLRLAFPTYLVRAALACKRWLRVVSGSAFLRRFRTLHPPRVLGFYAHSRTLSKPSEFWPRVSNPPEFASAIRRADSVFNAFPAGRKLCVVRSRDDDGCLVVAFVGPSSFIDVVFSPLLYPGRDWVILPSCDQLTAHKCKSAPCFNSCTSSVLVPERSSDGLQGLMLLQIFRGRQHRRTTIQTNFLQNGKWCLHTSVTTELLEKGFLAVMATGHKVYMTTCENIFVLDLVSSTCSVIDYPEKYHRGLFDYPDKYHRGLLSKADDSGVCLINVNDNSQLRIWLHRMVNGSLGNWLLKDTICLQTVFADLGMPIGPFKLRCAGENAEFALLEMEAGIFYFNKSEQDCGKIVPDDAGEYLFSFLSP